MVVFVAAGIEGTSITSYEEGVEEFRVCLCVSLCVLCGWVVCSLCVLCASIVVPKKSLVHRNFLN